MVRLGKKRCRAKLPKNTYGAGPYFGRCDLPRGHSGNHELERGMDLVKFQVQVVGTRIGVITDE